MESDLFELISTLTDRAARQYATIASARALPAPVDAYVTDPASRWAVAAAIAGRTLPINIATARALEVAVAQLDLVA